MRAGTYALYAYATQGAGTDQLEMDGVAVSGASLDLGAISWTPRQYGKLLWQIGQADRMAAEYKFGNELRNIKWVGMAPADLTYTIGRSTARDEWYFAQGKPGNWDVKFNVAGEQSGTAHLTVAIAGVSVNPKVTISVNGKEVKSLAYGNDAATYRAALRSARYVVEDVAFPAELLVKGRMSCASA